MADEITDETSAGDLRKMLERALADKKKAEAELGTIKAEKRTTDVASILKAKGAPEKAAKFYTGDPDEAAVSAWLEENKDVFPVTAPTPGAPAPTPGQPAPAGQAQPDLNTLAAQLVAQATASGDSGDNDFIGSASGAPVTDVAQLAQFEQLMRNTPRTPEGYAQIAKSGLFPRNPNQI